MLIDRRLFINFDWLFFLIVLALCLIGVLLIYSAASGPFAQINKGLYLKQLYWIAIGIIAMLIVVSVDYHHLAQWGMFFYIFNILSLAFVLITGHGRVERWIRIFGMNLQPSEFTKFCIILALAQFFKDKKTNEITLKDCGITFGLMAIPLIMILKQPDLGTAILLLPLVLTILYIAGIKIRWLVGAIGAGLAISPLLWLGLKQYQKNRILSFIKPDLDPLGSGYQVLQSKIAVGSGKFWGQGFLSGTQCRLRFIPQHHTDFIFSLLAEEWGFWGAAITLGLFFFLLLKGMDICVHAKDGLGTILSFSLIIILTLYILINIGMVTGIMPVTGIPLPFISYGGSAMLGNFLVIGLLLNIKMRRFE